MAVAKRYVNMVEVEPDVLLLIFDRFGGIFVNASGCPTLPTGRVDRRSPFCQHQPAWTNNGVYAMRVRVGGVDGTPIGAEDG